MTRKPRNNPGSKSSAAVGETNPRRLALDILLRCLGEDGVSGGYSNILIDRALSESNLSPVDKGLCTWIVSGVIERKITIDYIVSKLSSRPLSEINPKVLNIIRIGILQLRYSEKIPEHAAVNESVGLAAKPVRGFVNAVLRSYLRQKDSIEFPSKENDILTWMSVEYSVPTELCGRFTEIFGAFKAEEIFKAGFSVRGLTLRTNTLKNTRDELAELLKSEGIESINCKDSPYGLRIGTGHGIPKAVTEGLCYVQDESSQICAAVLDAKPGMNVLDVCACPGSKSFGAAMTMENTGTITSCDIHRSKLPLIKSGAKRLGINIIQTVCRDSSVASPEFKAAFDRVICDVPCSGFGVMSGKPEIKYKSLNEADELPALQQSILKAASEALKPGGIMVYSTCTVLPAENEENVLKFVEDNPDFGLEPFFCGSVNAPLGYITLYPDAERDGFFIARIIRKK